MNDLRNLVVVCQGCHDKHHAEEFQIGIVKQTSVGPQREIQVIESANGKAKGKAKQRWTEEEIQTIESYLRKYPTLPIPRLVFDLKQNEEIDVSRGTLSKMRSNLT